MDQVAGSGAFHFQHAGFQRFDSGLAQVLANGRVKAGAVQQAFLIDRLAIAIPQHPPGRRRRRTGQGTLQAGLAQAVQHALGDAFHRRKAPPFADHAHGVAQPFQPQGHRRTGRAGAEYDDLSHGHGAPGR
ncbi:hypothetical protein D9M72_290330 [compost metagenome]